MRPVCGDPMMAVSRLPWLRGEEQDDAPPFALPGFLAEAAQGVFVGRPGPAGPDIADLNHTAADVLGAPTRQLCGALLADWRCCARCPDSSRR